MALNGTIKVNNTPKNVGKEQSILLCSWSDVQPNPWNPNKMNERQFAAELESIMHNGFLDPVTVREHAMEGYEIIDGEHRWKALQYLKECWDKGTIEYAEDAVYDPSIGWKNPDGTLLKAEQFIPPLAELLEEGLVPVINLGHISDMQAKKLTLILNETRGRADVVDKAVLLGDIMKEAEISISELQLGLPYKEKELNELIGLGSFDWDSMESMDFEEDPAETSAPVSDGKKVTDKMAEDISVDSQDTAPEAAQVTSMICCPNCGYEFNN